MRLIHKMGLFLCLIIGVGLLLSAHALAAPPSSPATSGPLKTAGANGQTVTCSSYNDAKGAVLGTVIPCLSHTIEEGTIRMAAEMSRFLLPAFWAFVTLAIVFQGILAAQGERHLGPRIFLFIVKLTFIVFFVNNLGGMIPDIFDVMKEGEDIMAGALLPIDANHGFHCDFQAYLPSDRPGHILWAEMDCALGKIMGFALGDASSDKPSMILAASVLGLLGGFFFGGTFGFAVFFAAIGFLWSLLSFVVRTGFAFANAYLVIALYVIISPLFIPLALLRATAQYFQNWLKGLIGAMLTPVIVTAYSLFALLVFDGLLFKDGSDGGEKSMLYQLLDYDRIQASQRHARTEQLGTVLNDQLSAAAHNKFSEQEGEGAYSVRNRNALLPANVGASNIEVQVPNFEIERARLEGLDENALNKERAIYTQLLVDFAKLFILGLIILNGWTMVEGLIRILAGNSASSRLIGTVGTTERNIQSAFAGAKNAILTDVRKVGEGQESSPGGLAGTDFLARLPQSLQAGATSFLGGISR